VEQIASIIRFGAHGQLLERCCAAKAVSLQTLNAAKIGSCICVVARHAMDLPPVLKRNRYVESLGGLHAVKGDSENGREKYGRET
jgi:hypothetical protein